MVTMDGGINVEEEKGSNVGAEEVTDVGEGEDDSDAVGLISVEEVVREEEGTDELVVLEYDMIGAAEFFGCGLIGLGFFVGIDGGFTSS